jgi:hypothetical protein
VSAVADKLREARALIERGWTRGESYRDGRVCSLGALATVLTGDPNAALYGREYTQIARIFAQIIGEEDALYEWNDAQKSKRPVLAAFDKAIELAEAEQ